MDRRRLTPTVIAAVVAWCALPLLAGPLLADVLDDRSDGFRTTASVGAWAWWFVVVLALIVARPLTLTLARIGVPAAVVAVAWAALDSDEAVDIVMAVAAATIAALLVMLPAVGDRAVDAVSYGDERRFLLRAPGPALVLMVPTWALTVAGIATGPLLLAARVWVTGAVATVVGVAVAIFGFRALHQLVRRFLVFVPNGLVVHDAAVLREPVLFTRREVARIGPAAETTTAEDLTAQALGLALEVGLAAEVELPVVTGRQTTEERSVRALLASPTRPAAVLELAAERGYRVG